MTAAIELPAVRSEATGTWRKPRSSFRRPAPAQRNTLRAILAAFEPIELAEIGDAALLSRSERKFLIPQYLLGSILTELRDDYRVLEVAGQRLSKYRTLYYDTEDMTLYYRHHAGRPDRYKVRSREYVDSRAAFLEVKHRIGGRRTVKSRIPIQGPLTEFTSRDADFLASTCPYPAERLAAVLLNDYTRITLVSRRRAERVTLDLDLSFTRRKDCVRLPGIVVAEVKYAELRHVSEFGAVMRARHIRETGFSKYCLGVSLLYPDVKHNNFKAKQQQVARLIRGETDELH